MMDSCALTAETETEVHGLLDPCDLAAGFPLRMCRMGHSLAQHPLLQAEALAEAALRMDSAMVECRRSKNTNGEEFAFADTRGRGIDAIIRDIERVEGWVMLNQIDRLPAYAQIMHEVLAELAPVSTPVLGPALRPRAFVFVSSPGTLTPLHFDAELNVLLQVAGEKTFHGYEPREPWLPPRSAETFHVSGDNMLGWEEQFAAQGQSEQLSPGDAVFVPYNTPHWVEVGDQPSISLSITWCCEPSFAHDYAYRFNHGLRRLGVVPPAMPRFPASPTLRALCGRALARLGVGR
jgi:hypothetical protein